MKLNTIPHIQSQGAESRPGCRARLCEQLSCWMFVYITLVAAKVAHGTPRVRCQALYFREITKVSATFAAAVGAGGSSPPLPSLSARGDAHARQWHGVCSKGCSGCCSPACIDYAP